MKILCLQLARLGDIYQTWPVLNSLRRKYPAAKIDLLVRQKFAMATDGLLAVDRVIQFSTADVLLPIINDASDYEKSLAVLSQISDSLAETKYDYICNLSFSPFSSFLVDTIASPNTVIAGYTRHSDGYLNIPDDASSYFYAQVGTSKTNRIHLSDLFALVAGVELSKSDFSAPITSSPDLPCPYIVLHVGASVPDKTCRPPDWGRIVSELLNQYSGSIVLVGAPGEEKCIDINIRSERLINKIGKTQLPELFPILKSADAVCGGDSVLMQIASLTNTPSLNISFANVRFWETGPRADRSRILWFDTNQNVDTMLVCEELINLVEELPAGPFSIEKTKENGVLYELKGYQEDEFTWELTRALYMHADFPVARTKESILGIAKILDLASLAIEQLQCLSRAQNREISVGILDEVDTLIDKVGTMVPALLPLVRWFQCEKLRIAPGDFKAVLGSTESIFIKLKEICMVYNIQAFNDSLALKELDWKP